MLGPSLSSIVPVLIWFVVFTTQFVFTTPSYYSASEGTHFERLEGFEFVGHVIETLTADELRCGLRCLKNERCLSYNSRTDGACQLSNKRRQSSPDSLRRKAGSTYYGKDFLGHSCKHIRDSGRSKGDGEYWIYPEKNGNPLKIYCDLTNAGGGWLLILNIVIDDSLSQTLNGPETSYRKIDSYRNDNMIIANSAINELRSHVPFTQLRFHCNKQHGRTIHMVTTANSAGEAVIQYFTGQTETMPASCGSFVRMEDDNSFLAQQCDRWGRNIDGQYHSGTWGHQGIRELYDHPAFIVSFFHWVTRPDENRWECDDYSIEPSSGDFWRVFVR